MLIPEDKEHFTVRVTVVISPQFFGWVTGIGAGLKIISPETVRDEYSAYLSGILQVYKA